MVVPSARPRGTIVTLWGPSTSGISAASTLEQGQTSSPRAGNVFLGSASKNNATEAASSAKTTTGNSGTITSPLGAEIAGAIVVTAASGTTPTLDLYEEISPDDGTTWYTLQMFERLTGTGTVLIPPHTVPGRRRWSWTIGGTTPSFTFGVTTMGINLVPPVSRTFYDRTAGLLNGTLALLEAYGFDGDASCTVTSSGMGAASTAMSR